VFRKVGGRHGMVFGYVSPKAIHLTPLVPGTVRARFAVSLLARCGCGMVIVCPLSDSDDDEDCDSLCLHATSCSDIQLSF